MGGKKKITAFHPFAISVLVRVEQTQSGCSLLFFRIFYFIHRKIKRSLMSEPEWEKMKSRHSLLYPLSGGVRKAET